MAGKMSIDLFNLIFSDEAFGWDKLKNFIKQAGGGNIYAVSRDSKDVLPENDNELCKCITGNSDGLELCVNAHRKQLEKVKETLKPELFQCHAGFWNISIPIKINDAFLGAIMGCGILDLSSRKKIDIKRLSKSLNKTEEELRNLQRKVPILTKRKIAAFQSMLFLLMQNLIEEKIIKEEKNKKVVQYEKTFIKYNSLYKVYKAMRSTPNFAHLQSKLLEIIKDDTNSDDVFIYLISEENELVLTGATEKFQDYVGKVILDFTLFKEILQNYEYSKLSGHPLKTVQEINPKLKRIKGFDQFKSHNIRPMISNNIVIGCLEFTSNSPNAFPVEDKQFKTFLNVLVSQCSAALENALLRRKTELLSVTDAMTNLFNFRYFSQKLSEEITRCARYGHTLSLIMIDLDKFKDFNDTFGHPAGDTALRTLSKIMRNNIRDVDIAARYGGEEFCIILPETGPAEALKIIDRIREKVANHNFVPKNHVNFRKLTISAGVASFPQDATSQKDVIERADKALYHSKTLGRNRISLYPEVVEIEKTDVSLK